MDKNKMKIALAKTCIHGSALLNGLIRSICGTLNAALVCMSVYGFVSISREAGYIAVADFIGSVAVLLIALCNMYCIGRKKKGSAWK